VAINTEYVALREV